MQHLRDKGHVLNGHVHGDMMDPNVVAVVGHFPVHKGFGLARGYVWQMMAPGVHMGWDAHSNDLDERQMVAPENSTLAVLPWYTSHLSPHQHQHRQCKADKKMD